MPFPYIYLIVVAGHPSSGTNWDGLVVISFDVFILSEPGC